MSSASTRVHRFGDAKPNMVGVTGVLCLGLAAGLALVSASMGPVRHDRGPDLTEAAPAVAAATGDVAEASVVAAPQPLVDVHVEPAAHEVAEAPTVAAPSAATPGAATPSAATPSAAVTPAAPPANTLSMRRGRLAYIRCASGAAPCPRDRGLENAVWRELAALSSCAGAAVGGSDLRLLMSPGAAPEISLRDAPGTPGLDREALSACLEPSLTPLRTTLSESRYVVSFRFRLEDAR